MAFFNKRYHPPGTSPGTLVAHEHAAERPARIDIVAYDEAHIEERAEASPADCKAFLEKPGAVWVHVQGHIDPDRLRALGALFNLHPLALEDVLNTGQRPKVETYDSQFFVILSQPLFRNGAIHTEQVSLFMGANYVISFGGGEHDPFDPVRKRLRNRADRIRSRGADYLLYALLDVVIDQGFPVLEGFGEDVEDLEMALLEKPDRHTLNGIHRTKRELLHLRRMLWPQREVLNVLLRDDNALIRADTRLYLRDCYDHTIQIMDLLETYRDMTASMLDVYLSSVSNRLNDIMRVLTVIATVFMPLTFITSVYGMNFGNNTASPWAMPELRWYYGYPLAWLVMIAVAVVMLSYFKRKHWL